MPVPPDIERCCFATIRVGRDTRRVSVGGGAPVTLAVAPELFESYGIPGTPYGLLIDREGIVRTKGTTNTLTDLQTLVRIRPTSSGRDIAQ